MKSDPRPERSAPARPTWRVAAAVAAALLLVAVVAADVAGWPGIGGPLERALSARLDRRVSLAAGPFELHLIGGLKVRAAQLEVAAPAWSSAPHMLLAHEVRLDLRYVDLWRAWRGQPVRVESLLAGDLDAHLERRADGQASWSFGPPPTAPVPPLQPPRWGHLAVSRGTLSYADAPLQVDLVAQLALLDEDGAAPSVRLTGSGRYGSLPLAVQLISDDRLRLAVTVGRASLGFVGRVDDPLRLGAVDGRFSIKGPSLAAVGDPLGVTLPTTAAFFSSGSLVREGAVWRVVVDEASIGSSRLDGSFRYDAAPRQPRLTGNLGGPRLLLADLGPVVGTTPGAPAAGGKVLPTRPFDLAALRAMDADVQIDIAEVDLNTSRLEPLRPLRTHLLLAAGVLTLNDIEARTAQGRLAGTLGLDGRGAQALWTADLRLSDVELGSWIHQGRAAGAPPYVTGRVHGSALLHGQGRSTAEILGSLKGRARAELRGGTVSHLAVEAAGLDLAQGLGLLLKGDDALPVNCAVVDLQAEGGVFRPQPMVLDTNDSTLWVDGTLSLANESMDLRVVASPKDFSPLALRSPLRVRGSFAEPEVSVDKAPLARKLATALLLGLLNPLAALLPLVDTGLGETAAPGTGCRELAARRAAVR